jgi:hypothetical protein
LSIVSLLGGSCCRGEAVHLTPKAFDLLAMLIDAAPSVVSKNKIHARIVIASGLATLEDLGSKNETRVAGTWLKDRRVLHDGDGIQFGDVEAIFREARSSQPTDMQVSPDGR